MRSLWLALVWLLCAGAALAQPAPQPLVIGSKSFTESRLLAEIMAQLLEERGFAVERRFGLGGTQIVFAALREGQIDVYPEYTGTAWSVLLGKQERVQGPLRAYVTVARELGRRHGLEWLPPFGFNNSYALAMAGPAAERLGVTRISDLIAHQGELRAGLSHEFLEREDGYAGLSAAYGLELGDVKGMEHGLAYEAIRTGRSDLIDTYTTDGKLLRYDVRVLDDDLGFFPPYDAAPVARRDALERHHGARELLEELAFRIDDETMRRLNYRVEIEGGSFADVAHAFLVSEKLLDPGEPARASKAPTSFAGYLWRHRARTFTRIGEHLLLTALAVLLAIVVAVPLGIALSRRPRLAPAVLGATGIIQTVPSLALLALMIPVPGLGLGMRSAVVALFLYALLPIARNTYTGIHEVDADLLEAARAMGLTPRQTLLRVELPLAVRTIMAGVRTSTVISIGVATLAAFIGAGGLGDPIVTGLQLDDVYMISSGALPAAGLAVLADALLARLERALRRVPV